MNRDDRRERDLLRIGLAVLIALTMLTAIVFYSVYGTPHMTVGPINVTDSGVPAAQQ